MFIGGMNYAPYNEEHSKAHLRQQIEQLETSIVTLQKAIAVQNHKYVQMLQDQEYRLSKILTELQQDTERRLGILEFNPRGLGGPEFEKIYQEECDEGLLVNK